MKNKLKQMIAALTGKQTGSPPASHQSQNIGELMNGATQMGQDQHQRMAAFNFNPLDKRPANKKSGFRIEASSESNEARIYIYDVIGYWGVTAEELVPLIDDLDVDTIKVHINSPGGGVFDAWSMKASLERNKAKIIVYIDGVAASAASYLMLAGEEIHIANGGFVMIHEAGSFCIGNAKDMRDTADMLEKITSSIVHDYVASTNLDEKELRAMMADETWFDADEAIEHGFATHKVETKEDEPANMAARFDYSAFLHVPEALTNPISNQATKNEDFEKDLQRNKKRQQDLLRLYDLNIKPALS